MLGSCVPHFYILLKPAQRICIYPQMIVTQPTIKWKVLVPLAIKIFSTVKNRMVVMLNVPNLILDINYTKLSKLHYRHSNWHVHVWFHGYWNKLFWLETRLSATSTTLSGLDYCTKLFFQQTDGIVVPEADWTYSKINQVRTLLAGKKTKIRDQQAALNCGMFQP